MKNYKKLIIGILVVALTLVNAIYFTLSDVNALEEAKTVHVEEVVEIEEKKDLYSKLPTVEEKLEDIKKEVAEAKEKEKAVSDTVKETVELTVEERIKVKCDKYGVPYNLALAIARLETGWFKSNAFVNKNNVGGMMWKGKLMEFNSLDEGVDRFVKNLHKNYISCGLKTPEKIGPKYCPGDDNWIRSVRSLMTYEQ